MAAPWCSDGLEVCRLSLQHAQHAGVDGWGRRKEQPLLVSLRLSLRNPFTSAAAKDSLDESTMHYGLLAKRLRSVHPASDWESIEALAGRIHDAACNPTHAPQLLQACEVEIHLPKATLLGQEVSYVSRRRFANDGSEPRLDLALHLKAVTILTSVSYTHLTLPTIYSV